MNTFHLSFTLSYSYYSTALTSHHIPIPIYHYTPPNLTCLNSWQSLSTPFTVLCELFELGASFPTLRDNHDPQPKSYSLHIPAGSILSSSTKRDDCSNRPSVMEPSNSHEPQLVLAPVLLMHQQSLIQSFFTTDTFRIDLTLPLKLSGFSHRTLHNSHSSLTTPNTTQKISPYPCDESLAEHRLRLYRCEKLRFLLSDFPRKVFLSTPHLSLMDTDLREAQQAFPYETLWWAFHGSPKAAFAEQKKKLKKMGYRLHDIPRAPTYPGTRFCGS